MTYATPDEAEAAFYESFSAGDLEGMMRVWSDEDHVICIHPTSVPIHGVELVRRSWSLILDPKASFNVQFHNVSRHHGPMMAVHVGTEYFDAPGNQSTEPATTATNVYQLTGGGWRMLMHHASPIRQSGSPLPGAVH